VLNDEDEDSNTALHLASKHGHLDVVKVLVGAGAVKEARLLFQLNTCSGLLLLFM
jgi:ankyrin repeat protein